MPPCRFADGRETAEQDAIEGVGVVVGGEEDEALVLPESEAGDLAVYPDSDWRADPGRMSDMRARSGH
jgi:hypothetical protein